MFRCFLFMIIVCLSLFGEHIITVGATGSNFEGFNNEAIQKAIDSADQEAVVELSEGLFDIRNSIVLHSGTHLRGKGQKTVLKKCPGYNSHVVAPITNWVIREIDVVNAEKFEVGMGISFFQPKVLFRDRVPIRKIIRKNGNNLVLDEPINFKDYLVASSICIEPLVQVAFSVIKANKVEKISIENLFIDGNMSENSMIGSWWDSGIEVRDTQEGLLSGCIVSDVNAEAISLNKCDDLIIENCETYNAGRIGIHVGSGSQRTVIQNCKIVNSNNDGLFLCYHAQHGIYKNNEIFGNNYAGISLGYQDSDNCFSDNTIYNNSFYGIRYRGDTFEAYRNVFINNIVRNNSPADIFLYGRDDASTTFKNP